MIKTFRLTFQTGKQSRSYSNASGMEAINLMVLVSFLLFKRVRIRLLNSGKNFF